MPRSGAADLRAGRRRLLAAVLGFAAGVAVTRRGVATAASARRPIEIGLLPYLPTARLLAGHEPLRRHFEQAFQRPVVLSTAPDFKRYQQRVLAGDFDFYLIGPGPGWQAHVDRGHEVVAMSRRPLRILIAARKDGPVRGIGDLRGRTVAVLDPLTVTAQTTVTMLRDHGLEPGRDVAMQYEKIPFNAAQAVSLGEIDAAGLPDVILPTFPESIRAKLAIVARSEEMPAVLFMARSSREAPSPAEFRSALFAFAETPGGRAFLREFNHDGLMRPDPRMLRPLDRFLAETRRAMSEP